MNRSPENLDLYAGLSKVQFKSEYTLLPPRFSGWLHPEASEARGQRG